VIAPRHLFGSGPGRPNSLSIEIRSVTTLWRTGESVRTVELVAKALYDSLERDNDTAVLSGWEFGEPITIDGRFNLRA